MPETMIRRFDDLTDTPAEEMWREGMGRLVRDGLTPHGRVTGPPRGIMAWVVYVDGVPAGAQFVEHAPGQPEAHGLLTYVREGYRGLGLYAQVQRVMDADLLERGATHIASEVVVDPLAERVGRTILRRGGQAHQVVRVEGAEGSVEHTHYRRALRLGE